MELDDIKPFPAVAVLEHLASNIKYFNFCLYKESVSLVVLVFCFEWINS